MKKPATVLLVEPDADLRESIKAVLERENYQVVLAEDGPQAVESAQRRLPDLILLDSESPTQNGFSVCEHLRANKQFNDLPILFLTSMTDADNVVRGFAAGGNDFITKPVHAAELIARVRSHIGLAIRHRQLGEEVVRLEDLAGAQSGRLDQLRTGQEGLLTDPSTFDEINVAVRFLPTLEAGGDFYDIVRLSDDCLGFLVADVAGHDLGVTYLTGAFKALTVSFTSDVLTVDDTMLLLNSSLKKFFHSAQYATACYAKFFRSTMEIEFISAGHPAPLVLPRDGDPHFLDLTGDVLGIHETVTCGSQKQSVSSGDRVFLYTDALIECYSDPSGGSGGRAFGARCLSSIVESKRGIPLQDMVDSVVDETVQRCGGKLDDDVLMMGIEF